MIDEIERDPHWFAVARLLDNRLNGLMREIAEIIDAEGDPLKLRDMRISLKVLSDGASGKAWNLTKGKIK